MADTMQAEAPVRFEAAGGAYRHWKIEIEGQIASLTMKVDENAPLRGGYSLKLNSYDLGVDIELADAIERLRFEHPSVAVLVLTSGNDRIFSAGANIYMLGLSSHPFKVNFCKFTNETRIALEDLSRNSGCRTIAALNGTASGGGYELAIACDEIYLVDDGNSAVSLPEVPLLGVLPGTGGLTRLVDKRKVRRDLADVFSTVAEGIKGKRATEMNLVDGVFPKSSFAAEMKKRAAALAARPGAPAPGLAGVKLGSLGLQFGPEGCRGRFVDLALDRARRVATLVVRAPDAPPPTTADDLLRAGAELWSLRAFRELDQMLLHLRLNEPEIGVVVVKTAGSSQQACAHDAALEALKASSWFAREVILHQARVLRRMDATAKTSSRSSSPARRSADRCSSSRSRPTGPTRWTTRSARSISGCRPRTPAAARCAMGSRGCNPGSSAIRRGSASRSRPERRDRFPRRAPTSSASSRSGWMRSTGTTKCASPSRSARACRRMRSPAWRRRSGSAGPRPATARSSAASRRGRTGSSSGPTPSVRRAP